MRENERVMHKRSPQAVENPVLIPELFDALAKHGRKLRRGE